MTEETTDADAKIAALERALIRSEAARAAAVAGRPGDRLMVGPLADQLRIAFDGKGNAIVHAVDDKGHARWTVRDGKAAPVRADDVAGELLKQFPEAFDQSPTGKPEPSDKPATQPANMTLSMLGERKRRDAAPMSDADRARARANNPWRSGPGWNLTEQMAVQRHDPALAAELKAAAGAT